MAMEDYEPFGNARAPYSINTTKAQLNESHGSGRSASRERRHSDPTHDKSLLGFPTGLTGMQQTQRYRYVPDLATGNLEYYHRRYTQMTDDEQENAGQGTAIFMLCAMSLGVGVFVLPSVFLITGIGTGILLLFFYAVLATFTQLITLECGADSRVKSYEELASNSFGKSGEFVLAFFMAISLLTGNCGHIQTVGQLLHDIVAWFYTGDDAGEDASGKYEFDWKKTTVLYSVMLCLTIPWLFQRSLKALSGVGTLSVVAVLVTGASMMVVCFVDIANGNAAAPHKGNAPIYGFDRLTDAEFWRTDFWRACPTIAFVYTSILELFPVYNELHGCHAHKTRKAVYVSSTICFLVYISVSVVTIVTYGTDVKPNSLYNVPADNYWITLCCFALVIVITLLYPVINYPLLNAIETIMDMFGCCMVKEAGDMPVDNMDVVHDEVEMNEMFFSQCLVTPSVWCRYIKHHRRDILSIASIFVVLAVDIGVTNLEDLFGLCGSLGLSFVCYIFPCAIWLRTKYTHNELRCSLKAIFAIFTMLFSTAVMIYSTIVIVINIAGQ